MYIHTFGSCMCSYITYAAHTAMDMCMHTGMYVYVYVHTTLPNVIVIHPQLITTNAF